MHLCSKTTDNERKAVRLKCIYAADLPAFLQSQYPAIMQRDNPHLWMIVQFTFPGNSANTDEVVHVSYLACFDTAPRAISVVCIFCIHANQHFCSGTTPELIFRKGTFLEFLRLSLPALYWQTARSLKCSCKRTSITESSARIYGNAVQFLKLLRVLTYLCKGVYNWLIYARVMYSWLIYARVVYS